MCLRPPQVVEGINGPDRENKAFLPGFRCPEGLTATGDMAAAIEGAEIILMVIPTPFVAATLGGCRQEAGAGWAANLLALS